MRAGKPPEYDGRLYDPFGSSEPGDADDPIGDLVVTLLVSGAFYEYFRTGKFDITVPMPKDKPAERIQAESTLGEAQSDKELLELNYLLIADKLSEKFGERVDLVVTEQKATHLPTFVLNFGNIPIDIDDIALYLYENLRNNMLYKFWVRIKIISNGRSIEKIQFYNFTNRRYVDYLPTRPSK